MPETEPGLHCLNFSGKKSLEIAFRNFYNDPASVRMKISAPKNFTGACKAFNSLFRRIEAAGGILRDKEGKYLFIKRMGFWDLPKGKLDRNESREAGAIREVNEETGLTGLSITKLLPSTFHIYIDRKGQEILKETYWFEMMCTDSSEPVPQTEEEITEVKWFSPDELQIPLASTYAALKQLFQNYLCYPE